MLSAVLRDPSSHWREWNWADGRRRKSFVRVMETRALRRWLKRRGRGWERGEGRTEEVRTAVAPCLGRRRLVEGVGWR